MAVPVAVPVAVPAAAPAAVVLAVSIGLALLSGCSGSADSSTTPTGAPGSALDAGTPLEEVDTRTLVIARAPFCDRVEPAAVERALGAEPAEVSAYRSGQRVRITDDVADVVHEFGCRWTAGGSAAEAWVFAPPVTRQRAAGLAKAVGSRPACADAAAPAFGEPWGWCLSNERGTARVAYGGLFGDAWVGCTLTRVSDPVHVGVEDVSDLGQKWCAAVVSGAASAS